MTARAARHNPWHHFGVRILWHSVGPDTNTGYGVQSSLFGPRIAALGHQVAFAATNRINTAPGDWHGFPVYSAGLMTFGYDSLRGHAADWKADLVICLGDAWAYDPRTVEGLHCAFWTPVDTDDQISTGDLAFLRGSGVRPVAISRHGQRLMEDAGLRDVAYVPHGLDAAVYRPAANRLGIRAELGIEPGTFAVGMNAANASRPSRKAFPENFAAFAAFARKHPEALLFMHTTVNHQDGIDLFALAHNLGIHERIRWIDHYRLVTSQVPATELADWYAAMDVVLMSTAAEGFGIPSIEAQACGTPVIGTRCSATTELVDGAGWLVGGQRSWNWAHLAWNVTPRISDITRALEKACESAARGGQHRTRAAERGAGYDADRITDQYWKPLLDQLAK